MDVHPLHGIGRLSSKKVTSTMESKYSQNRAI